MNCPSSLRRGGWTVKDLATMWKRGWIEIQEAVESLVASKKIIQKKDGTLWLRT